MSDLDRLNTIAAVVFDVDGVFTDGRTWQDARGFWRRHFSVRDTLAVRALRKSGLLAFVITSETVQEIRQHMSFVGVDEYQDGCIDKLEAVSAMAKRFGIAINQIALVTANQKDQPLFSVMGCGITVPSADSALKDAAAFVTTAAGGEGAVAEACGTILKSIKMNELSFNGSERPRANRRSASF